MSKLSLIDEGKCLAILSEDGPLSKTLKGYELREEQSQMMQTIIQAFNQEKIALIEAGTGTGKSLAYLIPALFFALLNETRVVISTNTISLQEQLLYKDLPFLLSTLNIEAKAVLVKGMGNYLCLRKLQESAYEKRSLTPDETKEFEEIENWSSKALEGSRSELNFVPSINVWEKVCAESDACNHVKCPYYKECFFFKARKEAENAHILIVNHHLLFADLSTRAVVDNYEDSLILPLYRDIILDEAHHVEDVATHYFASKMSRLGFTRLLAKIYQEKKAERSGKLAIIKQKIEEAYKDKEYDQEVLSLLSVVELELPNEKRQLQEISHQLFESCHQFIDLLGTASDDNPDEHKLRLRAFHFEHEFWKKNLIPIGESFLQKLNSFIHALSHLKQRLLSNENILLKVTSVLVDFDGLVSQLERTKSNLQEFLFAPESKEFVRWIEAHASKHFNNIYLIKAQLKIDELLKDYLFNKFRTLILCSATLTTNNNFSFLKERLGLVLLENASIRVKEAIYLSPFNYLEQAMLAVPNDLPPPNSFQFIDEAIKGIWDCLEASQGHAFVLFTAYHMMNRCYQKLCSKLEEGRYKVFRQGDDQRKSLLEKFKQAPRAVLFGTDSFWEGVDVVGDALRCVIIVKLPFGVPSEPLIQARLEAIEEKGGSPFLDYTIPNAIVKFKQGFGRLIRHRKDRGCIVCLDPRLTQKGYGKLFLKSLPPCVHVFDQGAAVKEKMIDFYKKTYHLTK